MKFIAKKFLTQSYQIFESCLQREDTPPREPEIYEASLHGLRQHDSAEVSITVQDYEIMNMVRSILNSSLVKFLIFCQLQNTVVYPLILPSRITPSEIQKVVINRALLCQLCVQYFIEFHVNFASHEFHRKFLHAKKTIQSIDAKFTQIMYECSFSLIFT